MVVETFGFRQAAWLLEAPFREDVTEQRRLKIIEKRARKIGSLLVAEQSGATPPTEEGLYLAACLSSLPCLETLAQGRDSSKTTAKKVVRGLRNEFVWILQSDVTDYRRGPKREDYRDIKGKLSELAVYGVLWWGVTTGRFGGQTFFLPATWNQDVNSPKISDMKTNVDIIMTECGQHTPIQVKTSRRSHEAQEKAGSYVSDIVIIRPIDLIEMDEERPEDAAIALMDALVVNDNRTLGNAALRTEAIIEQHRSANLSPGTAAATHSLAA